MKLKKVTTKDRYGNQVSYEYEGDTKQLDPTKLAEKMMDMQAEVPEMMGVPDHPGEPMGTDTVPAWLTPGEFVMNAEAVREFGPEIEAMNNAGVTSNVPKVGLYLSTMLMVDLQVKITQH